MIGDDPGYAVSHADPTNWLAQLGAAAPPKLSNRSSSENGVMKAACLLRSIAAGVVLVSIAVACRAASPILMEGDELIVVTHHSIRTPQGLLEYEARAGRLPIRSEETGEVRGHIFFVAYVAKSRDANRPLTF